MVTGMATGSLVTTIITIILTMFLFSITICRLRYSDMSRPHKSNYWLYRLNFMHALPMLSSHKLMFTPSCMGSRLRLRPLVALPMPMDLP